MVKYSIFKEGSPKKAQNSNEKNIPTPKRLTNCISFFIRFPAFESLCRTPIKLTTKRQNTMAALME
jgi:hypothetical protein